MVFGFFWQDVNDERSSTNPEFIALSTTLLSLHTNRDEHHEITWLVLSTRFAFIDLIFASLISHSASNNPNTFFILYHIYSSPPSPWPRMHYLFEDQPADNNSIYIPFQFPLGLSIANPQSPVTPANAKSSRK